MFAINANRQLGMNQGKYDRAVERLSSGYRVNGAADDAAVLSISEKMRAQIRGLNMATKNIQDGISLIQTAEGALNETHSILKRIRELSVQAANDTNSQCERQAIQGEVDELVKEIDRIAYHTEFNSGIKPLLGAGTASKLSRYLTQKSYTFTATNAITVDNVAYNPGDSVTVTGVEINYTSNGKPFHYISAYTLIDVSNLDSSREYQLVVDVYNNSSIDNIFSTTLKDFGIDENGGIYYMGLKSGRYPSGYECYPLGYYDPVTGAGGSGAGQKNDPYIMKVGIDDVYSNLWIQAGANAGQGIYISLVDATIAELDLKNVRVMSNKEAGDSIQMVDGAIKKVSEYRSSLGAQQNRLECAMAVNDNNIENLQNSESQMRDADIDEEILAYSKNNILSQVGQAMLAQANQSNMWVLNLLR